MHRKAWPNMVLVTKFRQCLEEYTAMTFLWCLKKKGHIYVHMFRTLGMVIAVFTGLMFLGEYIYIGRWLQYIWSSVVENLRPVNEVQNHFTQGYCMQYVRAAVTVLCILIVGVMVALAFYSVMWVKHRRLGAEYVGKWWI